MDKLEYEVQQTNYFENVIILCPCLDPRVLDAWMFHHGQAAFVHSAMTVPLYDTLGHDTVEFVLKETGLTTVVCGSAAELQMVASVAEGGNCPMLQVHSIA